MLASITIRRKKIMKYYNLNKILKFKAHYNIILGERSNGKTFAVLQHGVEKALKYNEEMAIIRRWGDDFKGKRGRAMFNNLVSKGVIAECSQGVWNDVYYKSGAWYFKRTDKNDEKKDVISGTPFAYAFSISEMEHDKSTSYPNVTTIFFDEFIARRYYLPDEFVLFMNVCSTIVRDRNNVTIFMVGNTISKYSPYYKEMGLTNIKKMNVGDIDVYRYGDSNLKVAVELSDATNHKPSNVYFSFNNPKLNMITGKNGIWELDIYPHRPVKFTSNDIVFIFFILFDEELLQCEIVCTGDSSFLYIHRKTTPLQNETKDVIYSNKISHYPNWNYYLRPNNKISARILDYFTNHKVFYQDNEVGEIVTAFRNASRAI